jgi:SAM-dependent methyltransferase
MKPESFWDKTYSNLASRSEKSHLDLSRHEDTTLSDAMSFFQDVAGRRVLDLGCGDGAASLFFASRGADVVAIDTSPEAVQRLKELCESRGIPNVRAVLADAMRAGDLGEFDCVFGSMILHHIEPFDLFVDVLFRILKIRGKAFFCENSASFPVLMWFRRHVVGRWWVPRFSDDSEYPLTRDEVDMLRNRFRVRIAYPELLLFRLISVYLFHQKMYRPFQALDDFFYRFRFMRKYSYKQHLLLTKE